MADKNLMQKLTEIKAFFFDMDGVFTDGKVTVMPDGELIRQMHVRDGFALKTICDLGFVVAIVSAGYSVGAVNRFQGFGVKHVRMNSGPKMIDFNEICDLEKIEPSQVLYMGDDVADIECLQKAGLAVSPVDASGDVLPYADYVTKAKGGNAAVREVVEMVLRAQGKWKY